MARRPVAFGAALVLAGMLACGSFGEAPSDAGVQPGAEAGAEAGLPDGPPAGLDTGGAVTPPVPRTCEVGKAFGAPHQITSAGSSVESARFSADRKTAYLSICSLAASKTSCDLYTAPVAGESIGMPVPHSLSVSAVYDTNLTFSPDLSVALFASGRALPGVELYSAVFDGMTGKYGNPARLALPTAPSTMVFANEPYLLRDGKTLYFGAADATNTDYDLFRANGSAPQYDTGNAKFLSGNANSANDDVTPVVTEDEQELFFATNRGGVSFDVWAAKTANVQPWDYVDAKSVGVLNTDAVEYPTWVSPDACTLYFIRKSGTSVAGGTLWAASR